MSRFDPAAMRRIVMHVLGIVLILAGLALAARTGHDVMVYRTATGQHGGEAVDSGGNTAQPAGPYARMVRVVGQPVVLDPPSDPQFGLKVDTPVLVRQVEMFQWREMHLGGEVNYETDWVDHPVDSRRFVRPTGHANPASFPLAKKTFEAGLVRVGGFSLSGELMRALPGSVAVPPDTKSLPANMAASFGPYKNYLTTSSRPDSPAVGDLRVSWEKIPLQKVTVLARAQGDKLVAATDVPEDNGYDIRPGDVSLPNLLPGMPLAPEHVAARRLVSFLLAMLGVWVMLVERRHRGDPLLALGLGALLVGAVVAVLWLGHDASVAGCWLLVSVAGAAIAAWRLSRHKRRKTDR